MYKRMLVPLEGSKLAESAITYAADFAGRLDLDVVLLHVCRPILREYAPMRRMYIEHAAEVTGQKIKHVQEKLGGGKEVKAVEIRGELVIGYPAEEILRYADENKADIILMTTHGYSGLLRWAMGSVADKVLRASRVPVFLARVDSTEEITDTRWLPRIIIVPLDGSELAEAVLPHVETLARQRGAELEEIVLLKVCEYPFVAVEYPEDDGTRYINWAIEQCKNVSKEYLTRVKKRLEDTGLKISIEVLMGNTADEIIDYTKQNPCNLIVMSTHGRSGVGRWVFGSVANKILHGVSNPVFLVRAG
ncbi:MAG TPA: universal stress protein [Dehalococcoidia bacterium]|nr:universal stress protein [Dehalococcoidia bacterium]